MGRGLGPKQQEMLSWLQQQWALDIQPTRNQLMGNFVVDKWTDYEWVEATKRQLEDQLIKSGVGRTDAWLQAGQQARQHPDRPVLTPRPVAEGYRRALRTLVDRELVKVVADAQSYYRYCDPEADNPLSVVMRQGRYNESTVVGTECGRRRAPKVSKAEERRQALLKALPADGSWIDINDALDAFWLQVGEEQSAIDEARAHIAANPWADYRLKNFRVYDWMRTALLQLVKAGKAESGTTVWGGTEIEPKTYPHQKVEAIRLSVAQ